MRSTIWTSKWNHAWLMWTKTSFVLVRLFIGIVGWVPVTFNKNYHSNFWIIPVSSVMEFQIYGDLIECNDPSISPQLIFQPEISCHRQQIPTYIVSNMEQHSWWITVFKKTFINLAGRGNRKYDLLGVVQISEKVELFIFTVLAWWSMTPMEDIAVLCVSTIQHPGSIPVLLLSTGSPVNDLTAWMHFSLQFNSSGKEVTDTFISLFSILMFIKSKIWIEKWGW